MDADTCRISVRLLGLAFLLTCSSRTVESLGVAAPPKIPDWVVYPQERWPAAIPAQAGFDAEGFERLIAKSTVRGAGFGGEVHDGRNWGAVLARGGYIVHTWGNPDYKHQSGPFVFRSSEYPA